MSGDSATVRSLYVGRQAELDVLRAAADRVRDGGSARVLISGEAGIGKSRLIAEFTAALGPDWLAVSGGCPELGAEHLPYVAFLPIVRQLVAAEGSTSSGTALAALLPRESDQAAPGSRLALLQDLLALIERTAAQHPLLLVLEDLHWADGASRELFGYLARNLGDLPVLLVGTVRTGELAAGHPVRQLVAELGRRSDITTLQLGPLEQRYVGELLTRLDGRYDPARAAAIHRRSGGNPLFVEALAGDTQSHAGSPLRALLQERVARLSDTARPVLAVASVAGAAIGHDLLTLLANRSDDDLDAALRELVEHDQLLPTEHGYRFRHALIREAVYTGLLPGERRRLHARAATALAERPDLAVQGLAAAELAEHWYLAGQPIEAFNAALVAADEAKASFAYSEEHNHLLRALALLPQTETPDSLPLLRRAIAAAVPAGRAEQGAAHCTAALELIDPETDPEQAAEVLLDRALFRSRMDLGAREDLDRAQLLLPDRPSYSLGLLHYGLSVDAATAREPVGARQHAEILLEIAEALDDDKLRGRGFAALGFTELVCGNTAAAQAASGQAREISLRIGDDYTFVSNALWEISALAWAGRYEQLVEAVPVSLREVELVGMLKWRGPLLRVNLASTYLILGRWDDAVAIIDQVLAAEPEPLYRIGTRGMLATVRTYRSEFEQAEAVLHSPEELAAGSPVLRNYILGYVTMGWCELAAARQDPESAGPKVEIYLQHCATPEVVPDEDGLFGVAMLQRARLAAAPRNREIAADVARIRATIGELVQQIPPGAMLLEAYRRTILTAIGPGRMTDWDEAADGWRRLGHLFGLIDCLIPAAEAALAASNRPGARRRLEEAREIAIRFGSSVYLARIAVLGQRARLEPPNTTPDDDSGLTPREYDVLRLLARGLPNRQIAAELYISPATVGVHVGRILTKLNATTRTEATAVAHARGLLTQPLDSGQ
ncbi:helix-turn-helix transcriptional regulator [Kribbella antibiotica]|uniref:Helix-turn-helix transcriptional regulator n=1 Tax=Kribbella antibiotica TaxID=190195 RepID=A0A4R4ZIM7_9ACTN|nr:helix-turn-helix transcriptional regulator [Kribbella antibiotica]TDD57906.1 helix-turn-helix transcriptional regulator [Kribbella antibiotica]